MTGDKKKRFGFILIVAIYLTKSILFVSLTERGYYWHQEGEAMNRLQVYWQDEMTDTFHMTGKFQPLSAYEFHRSWDMHS